MSNNSYGTDSPNPYAEDYVEPQPQPLAQPQGYAPTPQYHQPSAPSYTDPQPQPYPGAGYQQPMPPQQPYYQPMNAYGPGGMPMGVAKSKVGAGLLGIFLGAFGVHNFYLGHTGKAVAQLLITLLSFFLLSWVSAIWGFIEGVLILASNPNSEWGRDARGTPLQ